MAKRPATQVWTGWQADSSDTISKIRLCLASIQCPKGGIQAEWSLGPNKISLEVDLTDHKAEWWRFDMRCEDIWDFRDLNLDDPADWTWFAKETRRLESESE